MLKKTFIIILLLALTSFVSFLAACFYLKNSANLTKDLLSPKIEFGKKEKKLPLLEYTIENLSKKSFEAKEPIKIEKIISADEVKKLYILLFTYESQGKKISGAINLKVDDNSLPKPAIIMLRGFVPLEGYFSGAGSKNAASVLATNNYVTLAPDFLGYGESESEPSDTWEARFVKVINVIDLIRTIEKYPTLDLTGLKDLPIQKVSINPKQIGIWGHSNGGQIALSTLEVLGSNLPTTLWAPVLAPFPYSILYFSDEFEDEGKETRKYVSLFEEDYDVFEFSLTKHLNRLNGPIQIQHGGRDDAALISWTKEFLDKVDLENEKRATQSAKEIEIDLYEYPNANHNMQPNWEKAIQKDLEFFTKYLK